MKAFKFNNPSEYNKAYNGICQSCPSDSQEKDEGETIELIHRNDKGKFVEVEWNNEFNRWEEVKHGSN